MSAAILFSMLHWNAECKTKEGSAVNPPLPAAELVLPGGDLQRVLDSGKNLLLEKKGLYEMTRTLVYRAPGQKTAARNAVTIADYVALRIADLALMMLIDGAGQDNIVLENVILDGNRYRFSTVSKTTIISPWSVGRFKNIEQAKNYADTRIVEDIKWCKDNGLDYMPAAFPGSGWENPTGNPSSFISREDGRFLWAQHYELIKNGSTMIYQTMFDELDESTQIYKVTNNLPVGKSKFDTYRGLPSDHYLWQVGEASKMLRGETPLLRKNSAAERIRRNK